MPKKYKLLIDSPEYPKGTEARQENSNRGYYKIVLPGDDEPYNVMCPKQVEENPAWQLIPEEPEKKIVERWRAETLKPYYVMGTAFEFYDGILSRRTNYHDGNYFRKRQVSELAHKRVKIMCRLMGLAETIEEGSTEMKLEWTLAYSNEDMGIIPVYSKAVYLNPTKLATFSTKELAQLFIDSAGQDALDWYGAVK